MLGGHGDVGFKLRRPPAVRVLPFEQPVHGVLQFDAVLHELAKLHDSDLVCVRRPFHYGLRTPWWRATLCASTPRQRLAA